MEDTKKARIYGGYRFIYAPKNPRTNKDTGYVSEHILVAEEKIGRFLKKEEVVHHLDKDKLNNDPENLVVCKDASEHYNKYHKESTIKALKKYHENQDKLRKANKLTKRNYERNYTKSKLQKNKLGQYTLTIPKWIVLKVLCAEKGSVIKFDFKGNQVLLEKE